MPADDTALLRDLAGGDGTARRRAVAKAITLVESGLAGHRARAEALLLALPPPARPTLRIGISGVPGVGKSTLIEALGLHGIADGRRIAVLAVDPSSSLSGGSILGDKTRMEKLSLHAQAFVRPSPSRGALGGVAAATRDAIAIVEAAEFDVVVVETVGIGQSEAAVAAMTDCFVLLQLPNAGDDLQAIKKGVLEVADLVVVNKADLDPDAAARAAGQLEAAWRGGAHGRGAAPPVLQTSAIDAARVAALWRAIDAFAAARRESGAFAARRAAQVELGLWQRIDHLLRDDFRADAQVRGLLPEVLAAAGAGRLPESVAARRLLEAYLGPRRDGADAG